MSIADISGSKKSSASPTHFSLHQCLNNKQDFLTILSKPESLPTHLLPRVSIFHISFVPSSGVPLLQSYRAFVGHFRHRLFILNLFFQTSQEPRFRSIVRHLYSMSGYLGLISKVAKKPLRTLRMALWLFNILTSCIF